MEERRKTERRKAAERRKGSVDNLFRGAVTLGVFEDTRKNERRKGERRKEFKLKIYLN